jgi:hypothetical protein
MIETVRLLAHASQQAQYEKDVPIAHVPGELVNFFADFFQPKDRFFAEAFSHDEILDLCELYGLVKWASRKIEPEMRVADLMKLTEWRAVMACAKELVSVFQGAEGTE